MNGLVSVDRNQGKFVEILETQKRVLGTEHPDTLNSMNLVANEYLSQGKFTEAATLHAQLLEVRKRVLGPEHRDTLESMYEFGWVLIQQQKFADAELVLRQLLASRIKLTPNRWTTSVNRVRLGEALVGQGRFAEAEALLLQGQDEVKQHNLAADFQKDALEQLVKFYTDWGKPDHAAEWQKKLDEYNAAAAGPRPAATPPPQAPK
jgi:tetratricopeptide (TPR) repeat protein